MSDRLPREVTTYQYQAHLVHPETDSHWTRSYDMGEQRMTPAEALAWAEEQRARHFYARVRVFETVRVTREIVA